MSINPKVSIVIPVYNRAALVADAIGSAVAQDFSDFEVVVCDNASDDGTWEVCKAWARRCPQVRVFRNNRNVGPVLNWLRCFKEARGEYLKVLFSDDLLEPSCLAMLAPWLEDPDVGFAVCGVRVGSQPEEARPIFPYSAPIGAYPTAEFLRDRLLRGVGLVSPGAALFRRRDVLEFLPTQTPERVTADWLGHGAGPDLLLYLQTAARYSKYAYVPQPLAFFRSHEGSFTMGSMSDSVRQGYAQAHVWFACSALHGWLARRALARQVAIELARQRNLTHLRDLLAIVPARRIPWSLALSPAEASLGGYRSTKRRLCKSLLSAR